MAKESKLDEHALVAAVAEGDREAHRVLFDAYVARIHGFVKRRISDESTAEEIVGDVFFELWRRAGEFRGESRVSTWLLGIAHYKCLATYRAQNRSKRSAVVATDFEELCEFQESRDRFQEFASRHELQRVGLLLEDLPEGQRYALQLAFVDGLSYAEIGQHLGVSEDTVKTRVARGRNRLRQMVEQRQSRAELRSA